MLKIIDGKIDRPLKLVLYGPEGIGKSTLAAQFPNPLFIDTEGGTSHMNVRRIQKPQSWDDLLSVVSEIVSEPNICKTLVVDTADWAEQLCVSAVCERYKVDGIESFGYGKGYTYLSEEFGRLIKALDAVIDAGINVVITAHAKMRKFEQPDEMGAYDRWEMKLTKQVAPLIKEWCDALLFLNYKTVVINTDSNAKKAQGGKRVMYATHHPCWDAKNRHGLPDMMDLSFENISHLCKADTSLYGKLLDLILSAGITGEDVQKAVEEKGYVKPGTPLPEYSDKILKSVMKNFETIKKSILGGKYNA